MFLVTVREVILIQDFGNGVTLRTRPSTNVGPFCTGSAGKVPLQVLFEQL